MPIKIADQPQEKLRPLPGVSIDTRVSPQDIVGTVGQGLQDVGRAVYDVAMKEREDQDRARLMDGYAQVGQARLDVESTIKQQKGRSALEQDLPAQGGQMFDNMVADVAAGMPDRLKNRFREVVLREREGLVRSATGHTLDQAEAVKTDARNAAVAIAMKKAENATDPLSFEAAKQEGLMALSAGGEPAEAKKLEFLDHIDKLTLAGQARAKAVELEAKYKADPKGFGAAIKEAEALPNVKLADATVARLKARQADSDASQSLFDKDALGRITSRIEKTRGGWDNGTDPDYSKLSDHAKGIADAHAGAARRHRDSMQVENRRAAAEARRAQAEANKYALDLFDALPSEHRAGVNLATGLLPDGTPIDSSTAAALAGVDRAGAAVIMAKQRHFKEMADKGELVAYGEFQKRVAEATFPMDDPQRQKDVAKGMDAWFFKYRDEHKGAMPNGKEVNAALADELLVVRRAGVVFDDKLTRAEFRAQGLDPKAYPALPVSDQIFAPSKEVAARLLAPGAPSPLAAKPAAAPDPSAASTTVPPALRPAGRIEDIPQDERDAIERAIRNGYKKRGQTEPNTIEPGEIIRRYNTIRQKVR